MRMTSESVIPNLPRSSVINLLSSAVGLQVIVGGFLEVRVMGSSVRQSNYGVKIYLRRVFNDLPSRCTGFFGADIAAATTSRVFRFMWP